jgi:hypothetical protein
MMAKGKGYGEVSSELTEEEAQLAGWRRLCECQQKTILAYSIGVALLLRELERDDGDGDDDVGEKGAKEG